MEQGLICLLVSWLLLFAVELMRYKMGFSPAIVSEEVLKLANYLGIDCSDTNYASVIRVRVMNAIGKIFGDSRKEVKASEKQIDYAKREGLGDVSGFTMEEASALIYEKLHFLDTKSVEEQDLKAGTHVIFKDRHIRGFLVISSVKDGIVYFKVVMAQRLLLVMS